MAGEGKFLPQKIDRNTALCLFFYVSGTITLASTLPAINDPTGLTVDGAGQAITISGNNSVRVLYVNNGAALTVQNLTIANGNAGSFQLSAVAVMDSTFYANSASSLSGGICNFGTLTVDNSIFSAKLVRPFFFC